MIMNVAAWYSKLRIIVININLLMFIIYKNDPSIINTKSNLFFVCFIYIVILGMNILINEKLFVRVVL